MPLFHAPFSKPTLTHPVCSRFDGQVSRESNRFIPTQCICFYMGCAVPPHMERNSRSTPAAHSQSKAVVERCKTPRALGFCFRYHSESKTAHDVHDSAKPTQLRLLILHRVLCPPCPRNGEEAPRASHLAFPTGVLLLLYEFTQAVRPVHSGALYWVIPFILFRYLGYFFHFLIYKYICSDRSIF